jgi:hypothetical protein
VNGDFCVLRYLTDGTLDTSFGVGGKVITDFNGNYDRAYAVAIQSDGKIVVVGCTNGGTNDFALVRYNTDGSATSEGWRVQWETNPPGQ